MGKAAIGVSVAGGTDTNAPDDIKNAKNSKYPPKKSCPTGIDPEFPQKNFVKTSFDNKGQKDEYYKYMYGDYMVDSRMTGRQASEKKAHNVHGYKSSEKQGRLRLSGSGRAHQIGKR